MLRRLAERERKTDYRTGLLAAAVSNPYRKEGKPALRPEDFFPYLGRSIDDGEDDDGEADIEGIKALFASLAPPVRPQENDANPA